MKRRRNEEVVNVGLIQLKKERMQLQSLMHLTKAY